MEFRKVWFEGLGYVELKTKQMKNKLLFLLRTKETDSFIMLMDFAMFFLNNGKISIKLYNKYNLDSKQVINDDEYYLIELVKQKKKKIVFKINGIVQDSIRLDEISTNNDNENDDGTVKVYIGGLPDSLSNNLEGSNLFSGSISDIIIDNE